MKKGRGKVNKLLEYRIKRLNLLSLNRWSITKFSKIPETLIGIPICANSYTKKLSGSDYNELLLRLAPKHLPAP